MLIISKTLTSAILNFNDNNINNNTACDFLLLSISYILVNATVCTIKSLSQHKISCHMYHIMEFYATTCRSYVTILKSSSVQGEWSNNPTEYLDS